MPTFRVQDLSYVYRTENAKLVSPSKGVVSFLTFRLVSVSQKKIRPFIRGKCCLIKLLAQDILLMHIYTLLGCLWKFQCTLGRGNPVPNALLTHFMKMEEI